MTQALDRQLVDRVRSRLVADPTDGSGAGGARLADAVRREGPLLGGTDLLEAVSAVRSELVGLGPLQPLLADPEVTDVLVHGPDEVWVDRGQGLVRAGVVLADDGAVRRLAQRLAASAGRRLDDAAPFADVALAGGVRLHAVLAPVSSAGTALSLRMAPRRAWTLAELVARGWAPASAARVVEDLVRRRVSTLVSGATGSGKTTVLSTLLGRVAPGERIVLVEDLGELAPDHPHVVHLEARQANAEGAGAIGLRDLVRQALRMRPDRLVVGEVRGAEVVDLLAALNTGHQGGFGTVHANSAADVPARLEALALASGLSREAVHSQLAAGVQAIVHLVRDDGGRRRLAEVAVLARTGDGLVEAMTALAWGVDGEAVAGPGHAGLSELLGGPP